MFSKLQRKATLDQHSKFKDSLVRTTSKANTISNIDKIQTSHSQLSQLDLELENLRKEIMSCTTSDTPLEND